MNKIHTNECFEIRKIPELIKSELIRLGISEGDKLRCIAKIPFGPIVIEKDLLEIAIGDKYARLIEVNLVP
jgi:ferrous iron transport protein A